MNFAHHFLDEALGSGHPSHQVTLTEHGNYLCIQTEQHPLYVYQRIGSDEALHPSVACLEHNGQCYKLAWIEDDQW